MSPITIIVTAGAPKDRAFVSVDGRTFEARSSAGAVFALCRVAHDGRLQWIVEQRRGQRWRGRRFHVERDGS
jgi:hypothetical protein